MDSDDFTRPSTFERLLTREQIEALDDLNSLVALQDDVTQAAKAIEVDLEFRSDDAADESWEHRARRALTAHYVCNGHLTRRIAYLRRGGKVPKQHDPETKVRKKEAQVQLIAAQAEHKRLKANEEREKTVRQLVVFAARQSLLAHFHRIAGEQLSVTMMQRLMTKAQASLQASLMAELPNDEALDPQPEGEALKAHG